MTVVQAHAAAFLALLDADNTAPALVVHDGRVPDAGAPPYVLVYVTASTPDAVQAPALVDLTMNSDVIEARAYCHSVGGNAQAARAVAGRVRAALLNVTPAVAGRVCWPIRYDDGQAPQRDESTGVLVMDQVDVYCLLSVPG